MRSDPFYLYGFVPEAEPCQKAVLVSLNIKYHPVVTYYIGRRIYMPYLIKIPPNSLLAHPIPGLQGLFSISMFLAEFRQGLSADYIHNINVIRKVGKKPTFR